MAAAQLVPVPVQNVFCKVVKDLATVGGQKQQATAFCSSYLHIPVVTSTATSTFFTATVTNTATVTMGTVTVTGATNTITTTKTKTETDSTTVTLETATTETTLTVSYSSITACASPTTAAQKKRSIKIPAIPKPPGFQKYDGKVLSSACKCLSIPTSTTTTTTTLKTPSLTLVSVTVPVTQQATATATETDSTTTTITNTITETDTVTEQTTVYTATSDIFAIPTFNVYAIGGDNSGQPLYDYGDGTVGDDGGTPVLQFSIDNDNHLKALNGASVGTIAATDPNAGGTDALVRFGSTGLVDVTCTVASNNDGTCPLTCQGSRGSTSYDCGTFWRIGSDADVGSCFKFTPYVVGPVAS